MTSPRVVHMCVCALYVCPRESNMWSLTCVWLSVCVELVEASDLFSASAFIVQPAANLITWLQVRHNVLIWGSSIRSVLMMRSTKNVLTHAESTWLQNPHNSVAESHTHTRLSCINLLCPFHPSVTTHAQMCCWRILICLPHAKVCGPTQVIYQTCVLYSVQRNMENNTPHTQTLKHDINHFIGILTFSPTINSLRGWPQILLARNLEECDNSSRN